MTFFALRSGGEECEGGQSLLGPAPSRMRGVNIYSHEATLRRETGGLQQTSAAQPEVERPPALSPAPPSTQPVQLFPKGGVAVAAGNTPQPGGGVPERGGGCGLEMSKDMAVNDVEWYYWKLGRHVETVHKCLPLHVWHVQSLCVIFTVRSWNH